MWTKFYSDHLLGTQNVSKGALVPELGQQYIRGAPSVDEADYDGSFEHEGARAATAIAIAKGNAVGVGVGGQATYFGVIDKRTLAQLAPIYLHAQTYTLKMFVMRHT